MSDDNVVAFPGQDVPLGELDLPDYFRRLAMLADADGLHCVACSVVTNDGDIHPVFLGAVEEAMALTEDLLLGLDNIIDEGLAE
tara:strand:- start:133 stop:384 length:252 start_codon:yes stop_codon:yes gene_type:complete